MAFLGGQSRAPDGLEHGICTALSLPSCFLGVRDIRGHNTDLKKYVARTKRRTSLMIVPTLSSRAYPAFPLDFILPRDAALQSLATLVHRGR